MSGAGSSAYNDGVRAGKPTVAGKPAKEVALRVMRDLAAWSAEPPEIVRKRHPEATFGLAGIEAYAADCENVDAYTDWTACHDVNGQWSIRNSTSVYLARVSASGTFPDSVNGHLRAASKAYRAAYEGWQELYALLGHGVVASDLP